MDKIFILQHCICEAYNGDFYHNVLGAFKTKEGALKEFEGIKKGIKDGTAHYFKDTEVEEVESPTFDKYVAFATYKWIAEDGATMYTKFGVFEQTLRD
jgi:hypothetical protein